MDFIAGQQVGPYRFVQPLGRGGMGTVSRAVHCESGREVALKQVRLPEGPAGHSGGDDYSPVASVGLLEILRREIHALAQLRHPGSVRILDHGVDSGLPWYAMELVEGETLRQLRRALVAQVPSPEQVHLGGWEGSPRRLKWRVRR